MENVTPKNEGSWIMGREMHFERRKSVSFPEELEMGPSPKSGGEISFGPLKSILKVKMGAMTELNVRMTSKPNCVFVNGTVRRSSRSPKTSPVVNEGNDSDVVKKVERGIKRKMRSPSVSPLDSDEKIIKATPPFRARKRPRPVVLKNVVLNPDPLLATILDSFPLKKWKGVSVLQPQVQPKQFQPQHSTPMSATSSKTAKRVITPDFMKVKEDESFTEEVPSANRYRKPKKCFSCDSDVCLLITKKGKVCLP